MSELWDITSTNANTTNRTAQGDTGSEYSGNRFQYPITDDNYSAYGIFRITVLSASLVISGFGNGFVLWTSSKNVFNRQYARVHVLLVSLSLSDLLQAPCQMMPQLVTGITKTWILGDSICKIHALTRSMLANVSVSTLSIITLERFLNVESIDGNVHLTIYSCAVVSVWILQAVLAAPLAVWNVVATYGPLTKCHIPFSVLQDTLDYTVAVRVVAFFLPLGVLWLGNLGVIYKLRRMDRKIMPLTAGVVMNTVRKRRSRKVTVTCLMLAIVFTITLTPFQAALLTVQTATNKMAMSALDMLSYLWLLSVVNCCVNPIIYGFFLKNLKQRMLQTCLCLRHAESASQDSGPPKGITKLFSRSSGPTRNAQVVLAGSTTCASRSEQAPRHSPGQERHSAPVGGHLAMPSVTTEHASRRQLSDPSACKG
ncbi:hypothetical protein RRG08_046900 [Elysia crispata]|uniref:G-protein coupled receptors family 1 profile domain-containing protein n=1 Tax=Elysia crispata TaxID=231223 RepID=A0AAE0ZIF4_9GAST|nr:hypothetical protein RRG08_046900 [Elysia crispata]